MKYDNSIKKFYFLVSLKKESPKTTNDPSVLFSIIFFLFRMLCILTTGRSFCPSDQNSSISFNVPGFI